MQSVVLPGQSKVMWRRSLVGDVMDAKAWGKACNCETEHRQGDDRKPIAKAMIRSTWRGRNKVFLSKGIVYLRNGTLGSAEAMDGIQMNGSAVDLRW